MRSSVRLIVAEVPEHAVMAHGARLAHARQAFLSGRHAVAERMESLARRTRHLPGGYPSLVIQRRSPRALRWLDAEYRMVSEARFYALIAQLPPRVRDWLLCIHVEARWLNSQERICRYVANQYATLVDVLAKSSSHAVPNVVSNVGGLHHE